MMDNRDGKLSLSREQIARLCDRHWGIGADGLILVEPAGDSAADYRMRYYNADGGEAEMCGNGARCFARYTVSLEGQAKEREELKFESLAGLIRARYEEDGNVDVELSAPHSVQLNIPLELPSGKVLGHFINTGVPHVVVFIDPSEIEDFDVVRNGAAIRWHEKFAPSGTNANFVNELPDGTLRVRTYERGVEGETLACGTGVAAAALVHHLVNGVPSPIRLKVQGGSTLQMRFERKEGDNSTEFEGVRLCGGATMVFSGEIEV